MKLVDVLSSVVPDFADVMDTLNRTVLSAMSSAVAAQQNSSGVDRVRVAVVTYAASLAERYGVAVTDDGLHDEGLLPDTLVGKFGVRELRTIMEPVTWFIESRAGNPISPDIAVDYRVAAMTHAGLLDPSPPIAAFDTTPGDGQERFLDGEIVAAYWRLRHVGVGATASEEQQGTTRGRHRANYQAVGAVRRDMGSKASRPRPHRSDETNRVAARPLASPRTAIPHPS